MATTDELLSEMLEMMRGGTGLSGGSYPPRDGPSPEGVTKRFTQLEAVIKNAEAAHKHLTENIKDNSDEFALASKLQGQQQLNLIALNKAFKEGKISADKYRQELGKLEREVEDLGDVMGDLNDQSNKALKKQIEKGKKDADALKKYDELTKSIKGLMTVSGSVKLAFAGLNAVGATAGKFVSGIQNNASGMELSSGIMTASIDAAGSAGKMAGDAIGTVGGAMTTAGGKVKYLGLAVAGAGMLISGFSDSLSKLAKFGVNVLQKEVEKTIKSFNDASSAGALFTDGMTGMRNASGDAGLTVEQFSGVLKSHSSTIAAAGLGVSDGAKKMGAALKAGGNPMRDQLLNLGYSFEEQAGLVAETMQRMKGSTVGPLGSSNAVIAEQTQKYAENLRVITAITGEDAKKKSEAVKQQMNQLAFQQKLAQKSPEQQAAIGRAMENMSDIQRKNFMDMVNFGSVINREGAVFNSASAGMRDMTLQSLSDYNNGIMDEHTERANQAKNGEQVQKDMLANTSIATAGAAGLGGLVGGLAESMGKELQYRIAWTKEAQANAEKGVAGQKTTTDDLTAGVHSAAIAAQGLAVDLQTTLTPAIKAYAKVAAEILEGVKKQLEDLGLGSKDKSADKKVTDDLGKDVSKVGLGLAAVGAGLFVLGGLATATGIGAAAGVPMMAYGGSMVSGGLTTATVGGGISALGYANGGISSGSPDGHLEKLHGTELIVPMVGGSLDMASQGYADLMKTMDKTSLPSSSTVTNMSSSASSTSMISNIMQKLSIMPAETAAASAVMNPTSTNSSDSSTLTELKKISEIISESVKTSEQTLAAQQQLVSLAGDQIRALDILSKHMS